MKFSKERLNLIDKALETVKEKRDALVAAVADYEEAATTYNETLQAGVEDSRNEWEDKSERWKESERGETVLEWIEGLEQFEILPIDIENELSCVDDAEELDLSTPNP